MEKVLVLYGSKYGSTKAYASWIAEECGGDLEDVNKVSLRRVKEYGTICLGGALYAGGVTGLPFLVKHYEELKEKHLILFTCGIADPELLENQSHIRASLSKSMPEEMFENVQLFHLRGAIDYSRLGFIHKSMMAAMYKMLKKKEEPTEEDKEIMATYGQKVDFTDRESITPIVENIQLFIVN